MNKRMLLSSALLVAVACAGLSGPAVASERAADRSTVPIVTNFDVYALPAAEVSAVQVRSIDAATALNTDLARLSATIAAGSAPGAVHEVGGWPSSIGSSSAPLISSMTTATSDDGDARTRADANVLALLDHASYGDRAAALEVSAVGW